MGNRFGKTVRRSAMALLMAGMGLAGRQITKRVMRASVAAILLTGGAASAVPIEWSVGAGGNGHFYEFIDQTSISWSDARANALASVILGQSGYLATITSSAEQDFLSANFNGNIGWLGGSDENVEATWKWMDGPEANTTFWLGGASGTAIGYANWANGEPQGGASENYAYLDGNVHGWADFAAGGHPVIGYYVEYGVPLPGTAVLLGFGLAVLGFIRRQKA